MKFAIVLASLAVLFALASAQRNYSWGEKGTYDILLSEEKVSKAFFVGVKVTKKHVYSQAGNLDAKTITFIDVEDNMSKNNGAEVVLKHGGPGSKGCTLMFESQRGHSIKNTVRIYGR